MGVLFSFHIHGKRDEKKICIIYTGGTIGMRKSSSGYVPCAGYLAQQMAKMPELSHSEMPLFTILEHEPLMDSANMTPAGWLKIATEISTRYDKFDGFVVLHGTDTMAYTASALPFILKGLAKPIILTGGQIPLCEIRNDSRENLITALLIASIFPIPEVCLLFGTKLLRGNRAVKINANGFDAFDSPNFPPLGTVGTSIDINWKLVLAPPEYRGPIPVRILSKSHVAALRLFPGISATIIEKILDAPIKGIVLETFGVGNAPNDNEHLLHVLRKANDRGIVIVNCSQCLKGQVHMDTYATGSALTKTGVISGHDMTAEAALAKMFYLFSQGYTPEIIKTKMQTNLRGELGRLQRQRPNLR